MALLPQPAPSSAGSSSHPSSPEPSLPDMDLPDADAPRHGGEHRAHHSASPASAPAALAPAHTHDTDAALASARSTPPQASPTDLARSRSTGRGGCWYVARRPHASQYSPYHPLPPQDMSRPAQGALCSSPMNERPAR